MKEQNTFKHLFEMHIALMTGFWPAIFYGGRRLFLSTKCSRFRTLGEISLLISKSSLPMRFLLLMR